MADATLRVSIDGSQAQAGARQIATSLDQIKAKAKEVQVEAEKVGRSPFFADGNAAKIIQMQRALDDLAASQRQAAAAVAQSSQQQVNALLNVDRAAKSASESADAFAKQLPKQEAAFTKNAAAAQKYYAEILGLDRQSKSAAQSAAAFAKEIPRQEAAFTKSGAAAQSYFNQLLGVDRTFASARTSAAAFERELPKQERAFRQNAAAAQQFYNQILGVDRPFRSAAQSASVFERELVKQERAAISVARAHESGRRAALGYGQSISGLSQPFGGMDRLLSRTVVAVQALTAAFAVREIVQANVEYERFASTLLTVSGSPERFGQNLDFLKASANAAGVSLSQIGSAFARFMIAGQNAGFQTEELRNSFDLLIKASRNFGLSTADTQGVIRALEQSLSKGKFMAEEVRLQLGDRLPVAMAALQKATGMTGEALNNAFEQGTLFTSQYFKPFIQSLYDMSGGSEAFARTSQTLGADLGRLQNALFLFARQIGEAGLNEAVSELARGLTALLQGPNGGAMAQQIGAGFKFIADNALILAGALGALAGSNVIRLAAFLAGFTPWGRGVTLALTAAGAAAGYFATEAIGAANAQEKLNAQVSDEKIRTLIGDGKYQAAAAGLNGMANSLGLLAERLREIADQRSILERLTDWADRNFVSTPPVQGGIGGETAGMGDVSGDTGGPAIGIGSAAGTLREVQSRLQTYQAAANASIVSAKDLADAIKVTSDIITTADAALAQYHDRLARIDDAERQVEAWREQIAALEDSRAEMRQMLVQTEQGSPAFLKLVDGILQTSREITVLGAMMGTTASQADVMRAAIENQSPALQGWVSVLAQAIGTMGALRQAQVDLARRDAFDPGGDTGIGKVLQRAGEIQQQAADRADSKQLDTKGKRIDAENRYFDSLKKNAQQITDNTAREQTLRAIEEQRARAIQGIADNTKKRADTTANAYVNERARLLDQISALGQLEEAGGRSYLTLTDGSRKYSAAQIEELSRLRNTVEVLKEADKAIKAADAAQGAVSRQALGGDLGALVKNVKALRNIGDAAVKVEAEMRKYAAGSDAAAAAQSKLDVLLREGKETTDAIALAVRNLDKERRDEMDALDLRVQQAQDQNEILRLESAGNDKATEAIARLKAQRALEAIETQRRNELGKIDIQIAALQAKSADDLTGAIYEQVEALKAHRAADAGRYDALAAAEGARPMLERNRDLAREAASIWQEPFREAARSIQSAFADAFEGIFSGGIKSFSDLGKTIRNIFIKLAAQIAALMVFRPVVGGILSSFGASDSFMRSLGILPAAASASGQGSSSGGGLGDMLGIGKLFGDAGGFLGLPTFGNALANLTGTGAFASSFVGPMTAAQTATASAGTLASVASVAMPVLAGLAVAVPLIMSFFKSKPSNKGAEYSFMTDADWTTQFEGTKHPDQMALVRSFAEPLQNAIVGMEDRFGVVRRADATIGTNFGIKEGSSFFYDRGPRDGGIENRQVFKFDPEDQASIQQALDQLMVAFLKDADWSGIGARIGEQAAADVATALENSAATTLDELLADISFAESFQTFADLGSGALDPLALATKNFADAGRSAAQQVATAADTFKTKANDLGLGLEVLEDGTTRADQATKGYVMSLLGLEAPMSDLEAATITAEAYVAELTPTLERLGFTADEVATITAAAIDKMTQAAQQAAIAAQTASTNLLNSTIYGSNYQPPADSFLYGLVGARYEIPAGGGAFAPLVSALERTRSGDRAALEEVFTRTAANLGKGVFTEQERAAVEQYAAGLYNQAQQRLIRNNPGTSANDNGSVISSGGSSGGAANDNSARDAINEQIDSLRDLADIQNDAAREAGRLADAFKNAADSLRLYRLGLLTDPTNNPASLGDQLAEAQRQQAAALARVLAGGPDAPDAARELQQVSDTVLSLGRSVFGSSPQYVALFDRTIGMLTQAEGAAQTFEQQQLSLQSVANSELARLNTQIEQLRGQLSSSSGGGGSTGGGSTGGGGTTGGGTTGGSYAFGYSGLGRQQGESADAFIRRQFPKVAASMGSAVITEQAGYNWAQSLHASGLSGLTNAGYFSAALKAGFPGPFVGSAHTDFLSPGGVAVDARWQSFITELRKLTTVPVGFFGYPFAHGGLVTGGTPGMDSVPAMLMPGERVFSVPHSRIIEGLAARAGNDNGGVVSELRRTNAILERRLGMMEARLAQIDKGQERGNKTRDEMRSDARSMAAARAPKVGSAPIRSGRQHAA